MSQRKGARYQGSRVGIPCGGFLERQFGQLMRGLRGRGISEARPWRQRGSTEPPRCQPARVLALSTAYGPPQKVAPKEQLFRMITMQV